MCVCVSSFPKRKSSGMYFSQKTKNNSGFSIMTDT